MARAGPIVRRALAVGALAAATWLGAGPAAARYTWDLPRGFPEPPVPADNPMSEAKVALGRHLFYDTRLSENGTQSCASCHVQALAFTDGRPRSVGSTGETHPRNSMSLVNVAYAATLTWANPTLTRLEAQAETPLFGAHPVEMGLRRDGSRLVDLAADPVYARLVADAFPDLDGRWTWAEVTKALASFQRAIVSARSPYDRYHYARDDTAVSAAAVRGEVLFHSRPLSCFTCHGGVLFSGASVTAARPEAAETFRNTGLYNLGGLLSYPVPNTGLHETSGRREDVGKFKAPTLRNIEVTAPYMHDGSIATLEEVIAHYAAGGRTIASGPYAGAGRDNPRKDPAIRGFALSDSQRADLVAFLRTLTDHAVLADPRFSNPWPE